MILFRDQPQPMRQIQIPQQRDGRGRSCQSSQCSAVMPATVDCRQAAPMWLRLRFGIWKYGHLQCAAAVDRALSSRYSLVRERDQD